jgi:imidazolonepropionase-like amidohydrolase
VAVGQRADLLLLGADPLHDVAHAQRVQGLVRRGRWLPRETLQAPLEQLEQQVQRVP